MNASSDSFPPSGSYLPSNAEGIEAGTGIAAAGLAIIMIGATVVTMTYMGVAMALFPLVVGLLAVFVAYGRWRVAPQEAR